MELETNLEVDYQEWFCRQPRMFISDLQRWKILACEFRGQKLQKMGMERQFGMEGLVEFSQTQHRNSSITMLVISGMRLLSRIVCRFPGEI